ncbi:MAG: adenylosuccinate lyase [Elusimicrobia bacterium]|nr:adenylosuccinate lyase [Elusimicrobiota bacterium]
MIERYTLPEMKNIWGEKNYYTYWLKVEAAVLSATGDESLAARILEINIDPEEVREREKINGHEFNAFIDIIQERLGSGAGQLHRGLTSFDIMDTARILQIKESLSLIEKNLIKLKEIYKEKALLYRDLLMCGRTHGRIAEPITLGLKFARYYASAERNLERIGEFTARGLKGKISGAVGTYSLIDPEVEEKALSLLGLSPQEITSQVVPRDIFAEYLSLLALISSSAAELATEVRLLSQDGIGEIYEAFGGDQTGSSAMPHKRNPVISERICGLARLVANYPNTGFTNIALWNERDITHSSNERVILEDASILTHYILVLSKGMTPSLEIDKDRIQENYNSALPRLLSSSALSFLLEKDIERGRAYSLLRDAAMKNISTEEIVKMISHESRTPESIVWEKINPSNALKHIPVIYRRLGLK